MSNCSSCDKPLNSSQEKITTSAGITFHRACLEQLLHSKSETTYQSDTEYTNSAPTNRTNEEGWRCSKCSANNSTSNKRCDSCTKPRYTRLPSTDDFTDTVDTEEQYGYSSSTSTYRPTHHDDRTEAMRTVTRDHYEDCASSSLTSTSDYQERKREGENSEHRRRDYKDFDQTPRPNSDEQSSPYTKATVPKQAQPTQFSSPPPYSSVSRNTYVVYIPDLPPDMVDNFELEQLVHRRTEDILRTKLDKVKCYSKLGIGVIYITDSRLKDHLLDKVGKLALDPKDGKYFITFTDTIELISYVVLDVAKELNVEDLPTDKEITRRWNELHKVDGSFSCTVLNAQFPNIYRIVSTSLNQLINAPADSVFRIKDFLARIYYCADCSFFENLPRSITQEQLQDAIATAIGEKDIPSTSLYIQVHKKASTACIIASNVARLWSTKSHISIDKFTLSKRTKLACRLLVHPVPQSFPIQSIINHREFNGAVTNHKHSGERLILELSDKDVFEQCLHRGALRIDSQNVVHVDLCHTVNNPEETEIDADIWYESDMLQCKPDIMQFVANPQHDIFRYKWNPHKWLEQFIRVATQKRDNNNINKNDQNNPTPDQIRHLLRVTVMLNTLATICRKNYMIRNQEVKLNLSKELKTIVYDHRSKLERKDKLPITRTPYPKTSVQVVREDCLVVYERMAKSGKRPLLLNMASATSPGGGFRKGDGAQEENIFRRSDYCRSLDVGLDEFFKQRPERLHGSSNCQLDPIPVQNSMYAMDEFGAIYTSGITVFRQSEESGYTYMENPLENVNAIAMAAYRDPEVKANLLSPKYAVGTRKKIENIFAIAYHHKHDCLVLSALGCGAFKNPPVHVAKLFYSVIEQYAGFFETIVFAIVDDHNAGRHLNPEGNYRPFADVLDAKSVQPTTPINKPNTIVGPYRILSDGLSVSDISIFDLTPCNHGAKCTEIYNPNHATQYSHPPLCTQAAIDGKCKLKDDVVHMNSFIHRNQCRYGGVCVQIKDENHNRELDHPDYCSDGGYCRNQKEEHLKQYRHLPLCEKSHKCIEFQKGVAEHCNKYRHCAPRCPYGRCCAMFHDKNHFDNFLHPFPTPCPRTPFDCHHYAELSKSKDIRTLPIATQEHCLKFAHVCKIGRNCTDNSTLHLSKSIHIARHLCSYGDKCNKLNDEEHLNSFTHRGIPDIRLLCPNADKKCRYRHKTDHLVDFRHPMADENGVVQYYGLNEKTNFVQNHKDNMTNVDEYITQHKWKPLPSGTIPREILNWVRTVQPIHRCSPIIFESILLHGHAMSREYMEHLKDPTFVANSVLHHSRIRLIDALKIKTCEDDARQYVTALISLEFEKNGFSSADSALPTLLGGDTSLKHKPYSNKEIYTNIITKKENKLGAILKNDLNALRAKALEIAQASIELHSHPAGIGHPPDVALGTDKQVFSVLGPHLGHYYGDVIIVFKREILHHPDTNYSIQAATSFPSGNAYNWRPWLGNDRGTVPERVKHYHRTKLHASVPGYEYATALELMALTSLRLKSKTMDISLQQILDQWVKEDSHHNIEAHLPQLIPVEYIDHIYIPQNLFDKLSDSARRAIDALFKHNITRVPHDGEADQEKGPFGPTPRLKSRSQYQNYVIKALVDQYKQHATDSLVKSIEGITITLPSMTFNDFYVLPLTISQAYTQYRFSNTHPSKDNITYIYWRAMSGDMMLALSNEEIDSGVKQSKLRCLICYVAPKSALNDNHYYEHTSYLASGHPFQHEMIINKKTYRAQSNTLYIGCNTKDFITYCLEIHRSSGEVILSHAGANTIYAHEKMSCVFNRSDLDLNKLEYIHVSTGAHSVPIRNLIICFEKQPDLHPTFDKDFKKDVSSSDGNGSTTVHTADGDGSKHNIHQKSSADASAPKPPGLMAKALNFFVGNPGSSLQPCPDNVNCLIQYSTDGTSHNSKFSHPCRYSELCRDKEPHLTHEPHPAPKCPSDKKCNKLDDPFHRSSHRHTELSDFLIPCRDQKKCQDKSTHHRTRYSHGEQVFGNTSPSAPAATKLSAHHQYKSQQGDHDNEERTLCKWGAQCHDFDNKHRARYSHPSGSKPKPPQKDTHQTECKWGAQCHDFNSQHRAQYHHPKE